MEEAHGAAEMGEAKGSIALRSEWEPSLLLPLPDHSVKVGGGGYCCLHTHCQHWNVGGGMTGTI